MMSGFRLNNLVDRWLARQARPDRPGRGVLVVSSGGLGDTILFSLAFPRFRALARAGEPVHLVLRRDTAKAAFLFPPDVNVIAIDYRRFARNPLYRLREGRRLRDLGVRVAISADHLRLPTVDDVLVMATGAAERYALEPRSWPKHDARLRRNRGWYTDWVPVAPGMAHKMRRWVDLANGLAQRADPLPVVRIAPERLPAPAALDAPTVVIHPFSAVAGKQHSVDLWRRILTALPASFEVVVSAGPRDLAAHPEFSTLLAMPRVRLDGGDLRSTAALIRAARFVVSVDSSILHLAAGTGTPTLALASAAHVVDAVPYDPAMTPANVEVLYHDMPCRGCCGQCIYTPEDGRYPCVARLDRDVVLARVQAFVEKAGQS